jgi:hypothetical protein
MTLPPNDLPSIAATAYSGLTEEQQVAFSSYYTRNKRSTGLMLILAIFLPVQLFFLGRSGLGILFLLTGGGFGVWYVIEWFLTPKRVRDYNARVASDALALIGAGKLKGKPAPVVEEEE